MKQFRPWTSAEQIRLRKMVASGIGNTEIAERLDRSHASVTHRKCQLRILMTNQPMRGICAGKTPRGARIVEVLREARDPLSSTELAEAVYGEATEGSVASIRVLVHSLRRRGVQIVTECRRYRLVDPLRPVLHWSVRRDAEAYGMHSRGVPANRIAARLGLPTDVVARRLCVLELRRAAAQAH